MRNLSASETQARRNEPGVVLVDVLPREHFDAVHIAGAVNACVYEVSFLDQVRAVAGNARTLIVYGSGEGTREAEVAAEKLLAAGFGDVEVFGGGLREAGAAGFPLERGAPAEARPPHGEFTVDPARSVIRWTGRNLFNHHEGAVRLSGGTISFADGCPTGGEFVVDLATITCADLEPGLAAGLVRHLHDADFFDVARFPHARFVLEKAEPIEGCSPGLPNWHLHGTLHLRGVARPFAFPAVIAAKSEAEVVGQAQVSLDRTAWGAVYGSGRFFSALGPHVVNDLVDLHLKIFARRG